LIEHEQLAYDALAGIATAGIPHSSALAFHLQQPSLFIRKRKGHGTQKRRSKEECAGEARLCWWKIW
jgi:orotate phosphoribosyltransferase